MSVWVCFPSKRPVEELARVVGLWRERGYKVAVSRDEGDAAVDCDHLYRIDPYPGYAASVNMLVETVLKIDSECDWLVIAADDIEPDPTKTADEIAVQCSAHFFNTIESTYPPNRPSWSDIPIPSLGGSGVNAPSYKRWSTFGVMQPTADRWGLHSGSHEFLGAPTDSRCLSCGFTRDADRHMMGAYIDRVAGSPWVGREFCQRINQGHGPLWPEYFHMGVDEELQHIAIKYDIFWQRPDLAHHHAHWGRPREGETMGQRSRMPAFLEKANSGEEWRKYKNIFESRHLLGFPGSEPL